MNTVVKFDKRIKNIDITDDSIIAQITDGRTISVSIVWSWRLSEATPEQRKHNEIIGDGLGVHWLDVDEDISADRMLYGIPAPCPNQKTSHNDRNNQATCLNCIIVFIVKSFLFPVITLAKIFSA